MKKYIISGNQSIVGLYLYHEETANLRGRNYIMGRAAKVLHICLWFSIELHRILWNPIEQIGGNLLELARIFERKKKDITRLAIHFWI